jgi:1,4-dihydroxy-2-naphthoate octaprenyltransferase
MKHQHVQKTSALRPQVFIALGLALISQSALATPGQSQLSTLQTWLLAGGATVITLALMYCGLQMAAKKTPFHEISHVFFGGILFGIAPIVTAMLISG